MAKLLEPKSPLILRFHRLMEAFSKSDDERDFYLNLTEGFILFVDLDKAENDLIVVEQEIQKNSESYALIPKLTFYETKKFMEGFVNEKVYDVDTKDKLLEIIGSREPREHFIEFIYDHLTELDKWQQYYNERSRIRIIEWLRNFNVSFVFEEDIDLSSIVIGKMKMQLFDDKVPKDVSQARDAVKAKAKTYYSNEALNPKPKRGRPPKQAAKVELEPNFTGDYYTKVVPSTRPFLFVPDYSNTSILFSSKFDNEEQLMASLKGSSRAKVDSKLEMLSQRLESLRHLSGKLTSFSDADLSKERRLMRDISTDLEDTVAEIESDSATKKKALVSSLAQDILPKKRGRPRKNSEEIKELIEKKKLKKVKRVTPIRYRSQEED